jgi:hypothetical protein
VSEVNKLWTKLYTRNSEADEIALHSAGATIRHRNPFEHLEVPRNESNPAKEFIRRWVAPFYMVSLANPETEEIKVLANAADQIDLTTTRQLLGYFDWRPKKVASLFAAINRYTELEDIIGTHLLKSEVCYAGYGYCIALAGFATEKSKDYLTRYLRYYLGRKDLGFEQAEAYCALERIDKQAVDTLQDQWQEFIAGSPDFTLDDHRQKLSGSLAAIGQIRAAKTKRDAGRDCSDSIVHN